jgi:multidrug efflux pump subunit AcrA (membrane-fusion protein)
MAVAFAGSASRLLTALPSLVVGALTLAWATSPTIPVKVRGAAVLSPPAVRRGFYARGPGQVQRLEVRVGDAVRQGQRLLVLDRVGQSGPGVGDVPSTSLQVRSARLQAVREQLQALAEQDRALESKGRALDSRRRQIETTNQPVGRQLQALDDLRREDVIAQYSPLWVAAQDLWLRNRAELSAVDASEAELQAQRVALRAQAAELQANRATLLSDALRQEVFSPGSGTVLDLAVVPGQPVMPGQKLGSIGLRRPEGERLALALFTVADAARLKLGDAVSLNPQLLSRDSFGGSQQRYGLVPGRLMRLSPESITLADVAAQVGGTEEAAHLMASARQRSFGEGGDLTSQLPDRTGAPLVLAVIALESAATPTGLRWSAGNGPAQPLPEAAPAEVEAEVEQRSLVSYVLPFWRWLTGARA